ncbi:pilus assembly protein PilM, partial [Patescibacteria group bacterium]|nr:pilus assembly protein PilM [Patescibacteria group bacterium]
EPPENMEVDYQLLGPLPDGTLQQIMVVAAGKKLIESYMAVFKEAKLSLQAIDAKPASVGRAIVGANEKEGILLLDITSTMSTVSIYEHGSIWVTGFVNSGGNVIRDEDTGEVLPAAEQQSAIKRLVSSIADEVDHVLKFYHNRSVGQGKVKEIRVSGGGSLIDGILDDLKKTVDLPVQIGKATITVPSFCDRRFFGALGSALYVAYETD